MQNFSEQWCEELNAPRDENQHYYNEEEALMEFYLMLEEMETTEVI